MFGTAVEVPSSYGVDLRSHNKRTQIGMAVRYTPQEKAVVPEAMQEISSSTTSLPHHLHSLSENLWVEKHHTITGSFHLDLHEVSKHQSFP